MYTRVVVGVEEQDEDLQARGRAEDDSHLGRVVNTERVFIVSLVLRKAALTLHHLCRVKSMSLIWVSVSLPFTRVNKADTRQMPRTY